ncbi:unnamed protein product [Bursaphelenchus xylophilus]|uniref:(pine wood nematode) hypothetical protein n=1 Tax=Bursaphelenchus xylophilus TaxID=6326 RepID=A0A1I7S6H6_BURXY|nr:unnamed protein product [Bursaphelenchus xylophilus]CAG9127987.1 unnamed protein product [Bursaphelenchus xylophilus]
MTPSIAASSVRTDSGRLAKTNAAPHNPWPTDPLASLKRPNFWVQGRDRDQYYVIMGSSGRYAEEAGRRPEVAVIQGRCGAKTFIPLLSLS